MDSEEAQEKARIDYGEANRGGSTGVFMDITLAEPFDTQYFVEIYPKRFDDQVVYIAFNTPNAHLSKVQPLIDEFIHYVHLLPSPETPHNKAAPLPHR